MRWRSSSWTLHVCIGQDEFVDAALRQLLAGLPQLTDFGMPPRAYEWIGSLVMPVSQFELLRSTPRLRRLYVRDDAYRRVSSDRLHELLRELASLPLHTLRLDNGPGDWGPVCGQVVSLMLPRLPQLTAPLS